MGFMPSIARSQDHSTNIATSGQEISRERDKCGYNELAALQMAQHLENQWGYGYDSLLTDLDKWAESPWVTIDSIGASVLNRTLWQLTITDTAPTTTPRHTVFIHARTHPNEVQGWWVTDQMINLLLGEDPYGQVLRSSTVFYIVPMYNPDGVELGYSRQNANGIDIESNWGADTVEVEVAALRKRFTELMGSDAPIEIALNMHASFTCNRYFVYHHAAGTSTAYTFLEQQFIDGIRSYFPSGIEPWSYFVSWTSGTPDRYPESWFWLNHGESVMALTYEDMNCPEAGGYDSTAYAILHGIGDFLGLPSDLAVVENSHLPTGFVLHQNYPNPFNPVSTIDYDLPQASGVSLIICDLHGREITRLVNRYMEPGYHQTQWNGRDQQGRNVPSGVYIAHLVTPEYSKSIKMVLLK
jgi:hypothetical protein